MNTKRLLLTALAVFVFIFAYEWVFHGILLKDTYAMTPNQWRPESEMTQHFHWLVLGQAVIALVFTTLFAQGFASGGVAAGIKLGIFVGLMRLGLSLIDYAVEPLPPKLIVFWFLGGLLEATVTGVIAGAMYKPTSGTATAAT
jgi:hypothetical protein